MRQPRPRRRARHPVGAGRRLVVARPGAAGPAVAGRRGGPAAHALPRRSTCSACGFRSTSRSSIADGAVVATYAGLAPGRPHPVAPDGAARARAPGRHPGRTGTGRGRPAHVDVRAPRRPTHPSDGEVHAMTTGIDVPRPRERRRAPARRRGPADARRHRAVRGVHHRPAAQDPVRAGRPDRPAADRVVRLPFPFVDDQLLTLQQRRFVEVRGTSGPEPGAATSST